MIKRLARILQLAIDHLLMTIIVLTMGLTWVGWGSAGYAPWPVVVLGLAQLVMVAAWWALRNHAWRIARRWEENYNAARSQADAMWRSVLERR